ncbi:hypothetical protein JQN72_10250 [Phycicoccus sp. CSK15P-2]|uniref:hypothetical protein n=1 Tax=Phycicoccus sp. CSK15P-2 TaxID=2807627 RepID=UPI001951E8A0|nr:hypothetical protein [Phycicoccus sp. CSK15P-2]MBM6404621.1 hypothetical protein [Phycicoccus sp. CSK15P-2]
MSTVPLRRLIESVQNGAWGAEADEDAVNVLCVRAADFDFDRLEVDLSRAPVRSIDQRTMSRLELRPGDIVLEKSGGGDVAPVGRAVAFSHDQPAITSNFAARVRPTQRVTPRFLVYVLRSLYASGATLKCIKQTTGIQNLDTEAWLQLPVVTHEMEVQRRIADFLDDQVARIDQIITARRRQEQHTSELGQSRLASLFRRVTRKGRLKDLLLSPPCYGVLKPEYVEEGIPIIRITDLPASGAIQRDALPRIPTSQSLEFRRTILEAGDVLLGVVGTLGRPSVVQGNLAGANVSRAIARLRPQAEVPGAYIQAVLRLPEFARFTDEVTQGTAQTVLNMADLKNYPIPVAETPEMRSLLGEVSQLDLDHASHLHRVRRSVTLLTEYKQSLITAAVTGELDVTTAGSGIPG